MRIDCEQCGAAYAIDDSLISERGVRAQCPKCGAQKVVKKGEDAAAPPPAASPFAAPGGGSPFAAPAGGSPFGGAPPPSASPFGAAPAPQGNPFGGAPAGGSPFGDAAPAGGSPFAAPAGGSPFGGAPAPSGNPFGGGAPAVSDPFGQAPEPPGADPFGSAPPPAPAPSPPPASDDPFANLGLDGGEAGGGHDPFASIDAGDGDGDGAVASPWQVKPRGGEVQQNVPLHEVREMLRTGRLGPNDEAGPMGGPLSRVSENPVLSVSLPKGSATRRAQGASAAGGGLPRSVVMVIGAIAVIGLGYGGFKMMPGGLFESSTEAGVNPFRRAKAQWSLQFPDVDGTSQEHVVEGKKHMRTDTAAGYRTADEHFRMALLLDVSNVNAIAGYVENFAQLPNVKADPDGVMLAYDGIEWALKKEPENASLMRAHGALKLAVGEVDEAQKILVQAQRLAPEDGMTKLLLARTHLERSVKDALALVRQVQTKDPELQQVLLIAGSAERRLGNFREARELLMKRLKSDPANVASLKEMARLELDLGNGEQAVEWLDKLLEAEQKDVDAHLMRAKVTYQVLDDFKKADQQLSFVITEYEKVAGDLLLPVLVHAAFVKTELGDLDAAQQLAERARGQNGAYPAAHYVLGRVYQRHNKLDLARQSLDTAVQQVKANEPLYEPLVRAQLADVLAAQDNIEGASRELSRVIEYAPRGLRGFFGLAAVHMRSGKSGSAFTVMRKALDVDPRHDIERPTLTDFPTSKRDLSAYADAFAEAKVPEADQALKAATEGIIRYHANERETARALFARAIKDDRYNHPALLYISVMDYEEGRHVGVEKRLKQAEKTTAGQHTITQLYLARAQLMAGEVDAAAKRLSDIIDNEPTLVQAKFTLGQAKVKAKQQDEALSLWRAVVNDAPDYLPVKRAIAELRAGS